MKKILIKKKAKIVNKIKPVKKATKVAVKNNESVDKQLGKKAMAKLPMKIPTKAIVTVSKPSSQSIVPADVKTAVSKPPASVAAPVVKKKSLFIEVTPDKYFVLCDGRKIKSVKELADVLQFITDDMFKYHVNDIKNDFSNWINDVFGEPELAKKIRILRNKHETGLEIYRYMFDKLPK